MIGEVVGAGALGLVIGYDVERRFAPPILGATIYLIVSTVALATTSYVFVGTTGTAISVFAEFLSLVISYLVAWGQPWRMTWI
jgi:hypothetical protein